MVVISISVAPSDSSMDLEFKLELGLEQTKKRCSPITWLGNDISNSDLELDWVIASDSWFSFNLSSSIRLKHGARARKHKKM